MSSDALRPALLRPGVASGSYPERAVGREDWLERAAHDLNGWLRARPGRPSRRAMRFVRAVQGRSLVDMSDDEFTRRVHALRGDLVREGLSQKLIAHAFTFVREAARRTLGVQHYDVQILAGWAMMRGMLVEMQTGEGKTLAVTLPAATAALAGIPVHMISANDYLVERDAESMRPLYERLGLSLGAVTDQLREPEPREETVRFSLCGDCGDSGCEEADVIR